MKRHVDIIAIVGLVLAIAATVALSWRATQCSSFSSGDPDAIGETDDIPASAGDDVPAGPPGVATDARFDPIDYAAVDAARDAHLADAPELSADDPMVARLLGWAEVQGVLEGAGLPALRASRGFELAAADLVDRHGPAGYAAAGELAWARFVAADNVAGASPPPPLGDLDRSIAPRLAGAMAAAAWTRTWRVAAWRAPFMPLARAEGLIDSDGRISDDAWPLVRLLHRTMWARRTDAVPEMGRMLSFDELLAFRRWQVEVSRGIPLERKLDLVGQIREMFDAHYHADRTQVLLLLAAGRDEEAVAAIEDGIERARSSDREDRARALESMRPAR